MPSVEQNLREWEAEYAWRDGGEEWSAPWGGSEAQWFTTLLPRVHRFLPADTILEIAPGYGRWTRFLKDHCSKLHVVDMSANCIEACRRRFASSSHIEYHVNDGRSLEMLDDGSIDFVFSFDSLVHIEADVMASYLEQLSRKLKPNGIGFVHHSNIGAFRRVFSLKARLSPSLRERVETNGWLPHDHWRAHSMDAALFENLCSNVGLVCIGQELVNWNSHLLIDSLSQFTPPGSTWSRPNRVLRNHGFMKEAEHATRLSRHYSTGPSSAAGAKSWTARTLAADLVGWAAGEPYLANMFAKKLATAKQVYRSRGPRGIAGVVREKIARIEWRG